VLTHAFEPITLPEQDDVDAFLPVYSPRQVLDPDAPVTIGAMVGPDAFTEVRYLAHRQLLEALPAFDDLAGSLRDTTGLTVSAMHRHGPDSARTVVLTLGSVAGTVADVIDEGFDDVGLLHLTMYRPFPANRLREALRGAEHVIVLERAFAPGAGGVVSADLQVAMAGLPVRISTVVAGLGGRPVTKASLAGVLDKAQRGELADLTFLDLRTDVVERELSELERGSELTWAHQS
jgi:pyruvate ferredoxin oxidoreductase alpha subunit